MSIRRSVIFVITVLALGWAQAASAQPRWGHERTPGAGACFYEDIEFRGRWFCVRPGERLDSMPSGMNDKISSIRLYGGAEVFVFRDKNLRGRSATFTHDMVDLRRGGWNDEISSLEVRHGAGGGFREREYEGLAWGREAIPRQGACFYEDRDFRGRYFCVPRGGSHAELGREFNNSIRSIRVFGSDVQIFIDRDFRGRSVDVRHDVPDLHGMWRDNISSIRVY